jgi:hypothetical protein
MAKGSKLHILHLLDNRFIDNINELLQNVNAFVENQDCVIPISSNHPKEATLSTYLTNIWRNPKLSISFRNWWIRHGSRTPQWDLISKCKINGADGILLVEAKAHKSEVTGDKGKRLHKEGKSEENDRKINEAMHEASISINNFNVGFDVNLSIENCYQLSNRVACAWWFASHNIPVVLLYLGFLNDTNFKDKFESYETWQKCFDKHANIIGIQAILNNPIETRQKKFVITSKYFDINKFK